LTSHDDPRLADLVEGRTVFFASGRRAGVVADVGQGRFYLKTPNSGSFWVRNDAIFTVDRHQVDLICEAEGLRNYILREP
jgi:hypothetical protein